MSSVISDPYLLLWLEGPLQAWGYDSKFGRRDTLPFPTKSGLLGLLCCARGAGGPEVPWLQQMAELDLQVAAYVPIAREESAPVRAPLLRDFHMVGSGYDAADPWESLLIPKTSDGKKAVGGGTKMTHRYFLQDATFAVALQVPHTEVDGLVHALQHPVWDIYLGRKCCVPTELIFQGCFEDAEQALARGVKLAVAKQRHRVFQVIQHADADRGEVLSINDVPVQFGTNKRYRDRQVTLIEG